MADLPPKAIRILTGCIFMVIPLSRSSSMLVEHLLLHLAFFDGAGQFQKTISKGGLAVVDVGDDGEIAYMRRVHEVDL